jgi:hypothetical protein
VLLNRLNGTTIVGLALAAATQCQRTDGPQRTTIADGYRLVVPDATCFVVGDVIFCRRPASWLVDPAQRAILTHELRHTRQYAVLGPVFWPAYVASCAWSYVLTGNFGARNAFERRAGLADGGYRDIPPRPILRRRAFPARALDHTRLGRTRDNFTALAHSARNLAASVMKLRGS